MVVKVYISGISGNKEVKKRQQRVLMILDSKSIKYDVIDITEPGKESVKDFMQNNATSNGGTVSDPNPRSPLPPQLFNDEEYCGDYDLFDLANEVDTLEQFLKLEVPSQEPPQVENDKENTLNGQVTKESKENSQEKEIPETVTAEGDVEVKEKSPAKERSQSREATPAKGTPSREATPAKGTPSREATPAKGTPSREATPAKEEAPEKELTPERQKSAEKEKAPAEKEASPPKEVVEKHESKEATPEIESVNENGTVSSRNPSEEKDVAEVERKKDPSELLIESEQSAE